MASDQIAEDSAHRATAEAKKAAQKAADAAKLAAQSAGATVQGIGASLSGLAAGLVFDHFGYSVTFLAAGAAAAVALGVCFLLMPETASEADPQPLPAPVT